MIGAPPAGSRFSLRPAGGTAAAMIAGYIALLFARPADANLHFVVSAALMSLLGVAAVMALSYAARESSRRGRAAHFAWLLFALAQAAYVLGDAGRLVAARVDPVPQAYALPDIGYAVAALLFIAGILLAQGVRLPRSERFKGLLDMGVVLLSSVAVAWTFVLAPLQRAAAGGPVQAVVAIGFAGLDFLLLFALLELVFGRLKDSGRWPLLMLAIAALGEILAAAIFRLVAANGMPLGARLVDAVSLSGYALIAMAGLAQARHVMLAEGPGARPQPGLGTPTRWALYLPYIWFSLAFVCLMLGYVAGTPLSLPLLAVSMGGSGIFVLLRQIVGLRENERLHAAMQAELEHLTRTELALADSERRYRDLYHSAERQAQELALLEQIRLAYASELDLSIIFRAVVEAISQNLGYTQVSLYLLQGDRLRIQHEIGYHPIFAEIPVGEGISGRVARTGQAVFLPDVSRDPAYIGPMPGIVSEVCVPLFDQGQVVGILNIESSAGTPLTEADLRLMLAVSEQVNIAIGRAHLYAEARASEERFRTLNRELEERVGERTAELEAINDSMSVEIGERIEAEDRLRAALAEKEVMLKEINHRVKNNLQVISSMLSLQSRAVLSSRNAESAETGSVLEVLKESQNRVRSMALVHEKLYRATDLAHIDFSEYVRQLAAYLFRSYGIDSDRVRLHVSGSGVLLGIERAVPCGLLINELISNSLKHGFPNGRHGEVRVELTPAAGGLALLIADDGQGMRPGIDFRNTESLGLQLVTTLADQLDATIDLEPGPGTRFRLFLPAVPT